MAKELNRNLRGLHDGAVAATVELANYCGLSQRQTGYVYVYWPFVTFRVKRGQWNVTHAPTGYWLHDRATFAHAVQFIQQLRTVADWEFTSARGRKARLVKQAARHLLPRLQRIA